MPDDPKIEFEVFPITDALVCQELNCDSVFRRLVLMKEQSCPKCGNRKVFPLANWISNPLPKPEIFDLKEEMEEK